MNKTVHASLAGFIGSFLLVFSIAVAQPSGDKQQIMDLMTSDSPYDYEKLQPLLLKNPDILEDLVFSTAIHSGRYRHPAFSGLVVCCFHGSISSEKFMDIAIRLIRSIKSRALPEINDFDLAYPEILSHFGYVSPWRLHQLELKSNSKAFSICLDKLLQYGLIKNADAASAISLKWAECDRLLGDSISNREMLKASFEVLFMAIQEQRQFLDDDAVTILLGYSKNLFLQALDKR